MHLPGYLRAEGALVDDAGRITFDVPGSMAAILTGAPFKVPLFDWSVVSVSGPDAQAFLQAQLCSDLRLLTEHAGQLSGWCAPSGRVLFDFYLIKTAHGLLLVVPSENLVDLVKRLGMYILRSAVSLTDDTDRWRLFGLQTAPPAAGSPRYHVQQDDFGFQFTVNAGGRRLCLVHEAQAQIWWQTQSLTALGTQAWTLADINDAIPILRPPLSDKFLPQMLNFDMSGAVSFNKGCYPGQEVVTRLQFRGRAKQRLAIFESPAAPPAAPGAQLTRCGDPAMTPTGTIISAAPIDTERQLLLAVAAVAQQAPFCLAQADATALHRRALPHL